MRKILLALFVILAFSVTALSQSRIIKGTVVDQNGEPVPFATISIKDTKNAVSADANANFTIEANTGDILVISAIGVDKKRNYSRWRRLVIDNSKQVKPEP